MHRRIVAAAVAAGLALVLSAQPVAAQGTTPPQPSAPASAADIEALRRQVQALAAGQVAIERQLEEIKALLQQGGARPAAPAPPPSPVSTVRTRRTPSKRALAAHPLS